MIAHGLSLEQMVELVRAGLAAASAERVAVGKQDGRGGARADHGRRAEGACSKNP